MGLLVSMRMPGISIRIGRHRSPPDPMASVIPFGTPDPAVRPSPS
jgi:hypothetical protein